MLDVNRYVEFLTENKLTEHQFLILWLVHMKDEKNIAKYRATFDQFNVDEVLNLIDRGWIEDFGLVKDNMRTFSIYDFIVTDKFTDTIVIDTYEAGQELIETYPSWCFINNRRISAKSCDHDELIVRYARIIKNSRHKHNEIVDLVRKMKISNEYAPMGIDKFVGSRHWNLLKEDDTLLSKDSIRDR